VEKNSVYHATHLAVHTNINKQRKLEMVSELHVHRQKVVPDFNTLCAFMVWPGTNLILRLGEWKLWSPNTLIQKQWLGYVLDNPGFESRQEQKIYLVYKTSRKTLGSIQPSSHCVTGFFLGMKRLRHVADQSPPCRGEKWKELYLHSSICLYGVCRENFTFFCDLFRLQLDVESRMWLTPD
jgi:hypothetical protein